MTVSTAASRPSNKTIPTEMIVERDVMVTMRDYVRLATDIYRPAHAGSGVQLPVILERTPYDKTADSRGEIDSGAAQPLSRAEVAAYFVGHGYIVVYQDCRGRGASEGEFTKYLAEGNDGVDTIAWLRQQPWSNGLVGMMGLSYAAHTQLAPACFAPEGLQALIVDCGGFSSGYHSGMRQGGALELRQATWAFTQAIHSTLAAQDPLVAAALKAEDIGAWFHALPWKPGHSPLQWAPEYEAYLFEQWTSGVFGEFWKKNGIYARDSYPALATIAQLHLSGWYDTYAQTAIDNYVGVTAEGGAHADLVIGPWTHGDRALSYSGDVEFGPAATLDANLAENWRDFRLRYFDRHLKNEPAERTQPVRLFVMGGGTGDRDAAGRLQHGGNWISFDAWPPSQSSEQAWHLQADGTLSPTTPIAEAALSYRFDPTRPVPTIGGAFSSGKPLFYAGAFDQRESDRFFGSTQPGMPLAARADVLVFQTEVLAEDKVLIGPVAVELWISSDCPDTDFTAKLIDLYPPSSDDPRGFAMNLTDGIIRCRYRDSWEQPEFMRPGEYYKVRIELMPTANLFKAGHRIRLDISSSNFPKFDVNPNSGEPEGSARLPRIATNTVHLGERHASRLLVRTLPASALESQCGA